MDSVIEFAETKFKNASYQLEGSEKRLKDCKDKSIDGKGQIRHSFAQEAAAREVSVQAQRDFVAKCKRDLELAIADEPRRDEERKKVQELYDQIEALTSKASKLLGQVSDLEREADSKRVEAEAHLQLANSVPAEKELATV